MLSTREICQKIAEFVATDEGKGFYRDGWSHDQAENFISAAVVAYRAVAEERAMDSMAVS